MNFDFSIICMANCGEGIKRKHIQQGNYRILKDDNMPYEPKKRGVSIAFS